MLRRKERDSGTGFIADTNSSTMQNPPRRRKEDDLTNGKICTKERHSLILKKKKGIHLKVVVFSYFSYFSFFLGP